MAPDLMQKEDVLIEQGGLIVPLGARVAYLFEDQSQRTRFARFIATGLEENDKCIIGTNQQGRALFCEALERLGVDVAGREGDGSLVIITSEISVDTLEPFAISLLEDAQARFRFIRCINDASWMSELGWNARHFLRLEVKGHLLTQYQPCTIICQYDTKIIERRQLDQIVAAHQFTVAGASIEKNPDRRPLGQIVFDGLDEQLHALTRLQNLSLKLSGVLTLDQTLDAIIEAAMTICRADRAAISYIDSTGDLRLMRHSGLSEQYIKQRRLTRDEAAIANLIEKKQPIIIEDVEQTGRSSPNYPAWRSEGIRSIVTLPLVSDGEVFGVIGAGSGKQRRYSQTEIDAMAILSAQASAAITNARLFEQLLEANSAKDRFLASLSHELRTPLTPILGWMHILGQFAGLDPLLAQGLETIERNARQQAGLINDLLDLTRITSGKFELARETTNIAALLQSSIDQMRPQADAHCIALKLSLPDKAITSDMDPIRIQQVMANLLNNAVKFTPGGGCVSVSLRYEGPDGDCAPGQAVIEVIDTGIGIAQEFLPHVFERFTQAHVGISRRYGGLGLGLAITRALVEMHGGSISADSAGAGKGSRFTVRLSGSICEAEREESDSREASLEGDLKNLGLNVLLIEDSRDTLDMLKLWLDSCGCKVWMAAAAVEGLSLASEFQPDIIISDIGMPEIDGYDLIRKLRSAAGLEAVPAIALTGYAREEDRETALSAGYNAHLSKPVEMRRLLHLMKKLVKK